MLWVTGDHCLYCIDFHMTMSVTITSCHVEGNGRHLLSPLSAMSSGWLGMAYTLTMAAYSMSIFAFEAAKASTKLGVSSSVTPHVFL